MNKIKIKVKGNEYDITRDDRFMDNGACIQLLTQSQEPIFHQERPHPVLPQRVVKEITKYERVDVTHRSERVSVFSLDI